MCSSNILQASDNPPHCLYIYSVQKMILKFDLKLVVVDLMSHCWMWSKFYCFISSVVNGDMSEKTEETLPDFL